MNFNKKIHLYYLRLGVANVTLRCILSEINLKKTFIGRGCTRLIFWAIWLCSSVLMYSLRSFRLLCFSFILVAAINIRKDHLIEILKSSTLEIYRPSKFVIVFDWNHQCHASRRSFCKRFYYNLNLHQNYFLSMCICSFSVQIFELLFFCLFSKKHLQISTSNYYSSLSFDCVFLLCSIRILEWIYTL